jgi:hypothetical protein
VLWNRVDLDSLGHNHYRWVNVGLLGIAIGERVSNQKRILRLAEIVVLVGSLAGPIFIALIWSRIISPAELIPFLIGGCVFMLPMFAIYCYLVQEYAALAQAGQSWWQRFTGMTRSEEKILFHWCPPYLLRLSQLLGAVELIALFITGGVEWTSGQEFTAQHAIGFSLGLSFFCVASVPGLASVSRMPGTYSMQFHQVPNDRAV